MYVQNMGDCHVSCIYSWFRRVAVWTHTVPMPDTGCISATPYNNPLIIIFRVMVIK